MLLLAFPDRKGAGELLSRVTVEEMKECQNIQCYVVLYEESRFLVVITGYGKVNIGRALLFAEMNYKVTSVLGVTDGAGFDEERLPLFAVALPREAFQFDVDTTKLGEPVATLPEMKTGIFDTDHTIREDLETICCQRKRRCRPTKMATADRFIADYCMKKSICSYFKADGLDRYSGSIGQAAYLMKVPYAMIVVISHHAGDDAGCQYHSYHREAMGCAAEIALEYASGAR